MSHPTEPDAVGAARAETVRYHAELYARPARSGGPSWPDRPHALVVEALGHLDGPVAAYDLGCGSGRHALLLAERLPPGSHVTAVDLLPVALDALRSDAVRRGVADRVTGVIADLDGWRPERDGAGLVVAFSVLEHLPGTWAARNLLAQARAATRAGGVHVVAVFTDRHEVHADGVHPAPVECPLTAAQARALLADAYAGWEVVRTVERATRVRESRDGARYDLCATLVGMVTRRPGQARPDGPGSAPAAAG